MDLAQRKTKAESLRLTAATGDRSGPGREAREIGGGEFELREVDGGGVNLTGYASVTEVAYDMGWYQETIARGAFGETLARTPDVQLLINHAGEPLARTTVKSGMGSLHLSEDSRGLYVEALLNPDDVDTQRLRVKSSMGLMDQMSFAFSGARSSWDEEYTQRRIETLDIHRGDVSSVNQGASPTTSFSMRSLMERLIEPSEEALAELRELLGPDDVQAALATLQRLAPASEVLEPVPDRRTLELALAQL